MHNENPRGTRFGKFYPGLLGVGLAIFVLGSLANRRTWPYLAVGLIVLALLEASRRSRLSIQKFCHTYPSAIGVAHHFSDALGTFV